MARIGQPQQRRRAQPLEIGGRQHAEDRRQNVADHHADQRAKELEPTPGPDVERYHGRQSDCSNADGSRFHGLRRAESEEAPEAEDTDRHRDHHDHEPCDLRRKERAQRPEQPRNGNLDQAREDRHAEHERQAARLQRQHGRRQVGSGEDRRAQVAGPDAEPAETLQNGPHRHDQHRKRQHVDDLVRREARLPAREHRHQQEDRDQPHVLQPAQHGYAQGRGVIYPVDDVDRFLHVRAKEGPGRQWSKWNRMVERPAWKLARTRSA
jgi:hypothetical protein